MDEHAGRMAGNGQPAAGAEPGEGYDQSAPQTPEGAGPTAGEQPAAGAARSEDPADAGGAGGSWSGGPGGWRVRDESARDWVAQLQGMIDAIGDHAGPVLREVAAKAAELAAVAAENAGPALHRAADVTTEVGHKVAARSKEYAAELRRQQAEQDGSGDGMGGTEPGD